MFNRCKQKRHFKIFKNSESLLPMVFIGKVPGGCTPYKVEVNQERRSHEI